jgi:hypothetical protein
MIRANLLPQRGVPHWKAEKSWKFSLHETSEGGCYSTSQIALWLSELGHLPKSVRNRLSEAQLEEMPALHEKTDIGRGASFETTWLSARTSQEETDLRPNFSMR